MLLVSWYLVFPQIRSLCHQNTLGYTAPNSNTSNIVNAFHSCCTGSRATRWLYCLLMAKEWSENNFQLSSIYSEGKTTSQKDAITRVIIIIIIIILNIVKIVFTQQGKAKMYLCLYDVQIFHSQITCYMMSRNSYMHPSKWFMHLKKS